MMFSWRRPKICTLPLGVNGSKGTGGFNGGGNGRGSSYGGGGATHIAFASGSLSGFDAKRGEVVMVAGGGRWRL